MDGRKQSEITGTDGNFKPTGGGAEKETALQGIADVIRLQMTDSRGRDVGRLFKWKL